MAKQVQTQRGMKARKAALPALMASKLNFWGCKGITPWWTNK